MAIKDVAKAFANKTQGHVTTPAQMDNATTCMDAS